MNKVLICRSFRTIDKWKRSQHLPLISDCSWVSIRIFTKSHFRLFFRLQRSICIRYDEKVLSWTSWHEFHPFYQKFLTYRNNLIKHTRKLSNFVNKYQIIMHNYAHKNGLKYQFTCPTLPKLLRGMKLIFAPTSYFGSSRLILKKKEIILTWKIIITMFVKTASSEWAVSISFVKISTIFHTETKRNV